MSKMRLIRTILKMQIKDQIMYPDRLLVSLFSMLIRCGVLLLLYHYVFKLKNGSIGGLDYQVAVWSMFIYFAAMIFGLRNISKLIMQDICSGNIEVMLARPFSYLNFKTWMQIGNGLYAFVVNLLIGSTILYLVVGIPETMYRLIFWPTLLIAFINMVILAIAIYSIIGLFAFWIEDITPLYLIIDKAIMILGGSYLPVALFPTIMKSIAIYSPFGSAFFITHTVYDRWAQDWPWMLIIQFGWIVILWVLLAFVYKKASYKLSVNGG